MTPTASGFESTRRNRRPSSSAAAPAVPLPAKKSATTPPGGHDAETTRRNTATGFWVGYPVRSAPPGGTMVCHHVSVGSLPRAAFSGPTRPGAMYGIRSTASASNQ